VKISDLAPGMLLKPKIGYSWVEVPWSGATGKIAGYYLKVVSCKKTLIDTSLDLKDESVLYLGTTENTSTQPTPGKQVVLAWGKKMTIDPKSWRHIIA
jgi:hypothetical protein|tara:strand:+ start:120 stop:413 length:294 start_codon:yes stop_codon:yes gene_type:complete